MLHTEGIVGILIVLISLLGVVVVVAVAARRFRLPYTVALVLGGLAVAIIQPLARFDLDPQFILFVFIPPLVFEAAFHLDIEEIRSSRLAILALAVGGVLLATFITGGLVFWLAGLPFVIALIFGALISATDPVAVTSIFRELGVSRRLSHILEGESLFNDGTSIVLFNLLVAVLVSGSLSLVESITRFLIVSVGGLVLGGAVGVLVSLLLRRTDDFLVEATVTIIVAFGTYIAAEEIHVSGVIAVVAAGIIVGNYGERTAMSPTTRIRMVQFWEYVAFLANSFVFLLIGLSIDLNLLLNNIGLIAIAIVVVLVARAAVIYVLGAPIDRITGDIPLQSRHVLFWGGLRGAIALALSLSLPAEAGSWQEPVRAMTFGVVLFTLLVQGTTIAWLLGRLGIVKSPHVEYETARARLYTNKAALRWLRQLSHDGVLSEPIMEQMSSEYEAKGEKLAEEIGTLYEIQTELREEALLATRQSALVIEQSALQELLRQGTVSDRAYRKLVEEINEQQNELGEQTTL